jgi:hypothetical protein
MKISWLFALSLLASCAAPPPASLEENHPDQVLFVELGGAPDAGLAWLEKGQEKLPLARLQQLCREGVWIDVAPSPSLDLSPLLREAQKSGCVPGFFGELPASLPEHSWSLFQPLPHRTLPLPQNSPLPPVKIAEQRPGMSAAIELPMTRPYVLQIGDGAAQFFRQMALDERPWCALVDFGDWVAQEAEADSLDRAKRARPEQAPALASWMLQDDALARMLAELVAVEQDQHTLVIVKGAGPSSPLLVCWPGHLEGGLRQASALTAEQLLAELCRQASDPAKATSSSLKLKGVR